MSRARMLACVVWLLACSGREATDAPVDAGADAGRAEDAGLVRDGGPGEEDAGAPDAGGGLDSGAADAGPVVPGELDLGPDARPSDYPEAAAWVNTPRPTFAPGEAGGMIVEMPVPLDDDSSAGGPPTVEWIGNAFGVAWGLDSEGIFYRTYSGRGEPEAASMMIGATGGFIALAGSPVGIGVAYSPIWSGGPSGLAVIDRTGARLLDWATFAGDEPDVSRFTHGHWWLVTYQRGDGAKALRGVGLDGVLGDEVVLPARPPTSVDRDGPRIAGLRSRAVIAWPAADGAWVQSTAWPAVDAALPVHAITAALDYDNDVDVAAYRDFAVVSAVDGTSVHAAMVDPWTDTVVAGPRPIGASRITDRRVGIAAAEARGFLGACWATGPGPGGGFGSDEDGVAFQLLGPDLEPWGAPLTVVDRLRNTGGCAIAWTGSEFIVAWWLAGGDAAFNQIWVATVRPLV